MHFFISVPSYFILKNILKVCMTSTSYVIPTLLNFQFSSWKRVFLFDGHFIGLKNRVCLGKQKKRGSLGKFRHVQDTIYGNFYTIQYKFYPLLKKLFYKIFKKEGFLKEIFLAVFQCCFFSYGKTNDKTIGVISTVDGNEHLHQKMSVF